MKRKHHSYDQTKILFKLAEAVSPQTRPELGEKLLIEGLNLGTHLELEWISAAQPIQEANCQFVCAISYFKLWKYREARQILESVWPELKSNRNARILYALTLNRCRVHKKANDMLWELIHSSSDLNEKAILLSIAVSNSIHNGKEDVARQMVRRYAKDISTCEKYGYFLRNSATLFQGQESLCYWEGALKSFRQVKDEYGELTTIVNMARANIRSGRTLYAKEQLEYAYGKLMPYGMEQLHIVANNLGATCLLCNDLPNAKRYLRIASLIAKSTMPKVYISINECCVFLCEGKRPEALAKLQQLENTVKKTQLPRLKARYFLAVAGAFCLCDKKEEAYASLVQCELYHTSSFGRLRRQIRDWCESSESSAEKPWTDFFSPAFLEYWIANPLSVMSENVLSG